MEFYFNDKNTTRFREQNICNLAYAQFKGCGLYDIPELLPVKVDNLENIPLQGFNFALKTKKPEKVGVHFFLHDYQFERVWNKPDRYAEVLSKFAYVLSPDFSPFADSPVAIQIYNTYRNRWCGRYWQELGISVIPTITIGNKFGLSYVFDGLPKNSIIAVSTMGEGRWGQFKGIKSLWNTFLDKLEPQTILLYGKDISESLDGNIIFKPYINSEVVDGSKTK